MGAIKEYDLYKLILATLSVSAHQNSFVRYSSSFGLVGNGLKALITLMVLKVNRAQ